MKGNTKNQEQAHSRSDGSLIYESDILRVSGEPFTCFNEMEVHAKLTCYPVEYLNYVRTSLIRLSAGLSSVEMPPKLIFSDAHSSGDFRVMPCVVRDGDRITKSVKLVGTNVRQRKVIQQITVGKSFLIDNDENYISHVFEACLLSSARTAICACIAIERLGKATGRKLTVIGAGRVGYYCAFYAVATGLVDEVVFADIDPVRARNTAEILKQKFPANLFLTADYTGLGPTDILVLATTSTRAIYHPSHFPAGLVISVGADIDFQHELSADLAKNSGLFVDTLDSVRYGDLKMWIEDRIVSISNIRDILFLLREDYVPDYSIPNVFISTGMALFDNLTMAYMTCDK